MSPAEVRDLLTATPFHPFRIIMSDGSLSYDVVDPLHLLVTNRTLYVGIPTHPDDVIPDRTVRLDLLHVTQLVPLTTAPKPGGNGAQPH
jgi:hypothetical protein